MICKSEMTIPGPSLALLLLTSFAGPVTSPRVSEWMNEPEDVVSLSCMYGFGISGLVSEYDASKRDRQWRMRCSDVGGRGSDVCQWTYNHVNELGMRFRFDCGANAYISGVYSDYDADNNDRMWRIECCTTPGIILSDCEMTSVMNDFEGRLEFTIPPDHALAGIQSNFGRRHGDRRWKFKICRSNKDFTGNTHNEEDV